MSEKGLEAKKLQNCFLPLNFLSFATTLLYPSLILNLASIILPIHHIVLGVNHLEKAIQDFEQLGFTVSPGGLHNGGFSHNALIHFSDGTFLELFAFRKNFKTMLIRLADKLGLLEGRKKRPHLAYMPRFMKGLHGKEGIMDFASLVEDIEAYKKGISYRKIGPAFEFSRLRPDGVELSWKLAFPQDLELPFLMSPYAPPQVPSTSMTQHANGALGIRQLDISVKEWDMHFQQYLDFLKTTPQIGREAKEPKARFSLNGQEIVLKSASTAPRIQKIHLFTDAKETLGKQISCRNIDLAFVQE